LISVKASLTLFLSQNAVGMLSLGVGKVIDWSPNVYIRVEISIVTIWSWSAIILRHFRRVLGRAICLFVCTFGIIVD